MLRSTEDILNFPVTTLVAKSCIDTLVTWLDAGGKSKYFVCANPHSLIVAETDPLFRTAIHAADLVTPDGAGILFASKILGGMIRERVTGSDIFWGLSDILNRNGKKTYRYFFLGSTKETLSAIKMKLSFDYPNIEFSGSHSPPHKPGFNMEDNMRMIQAVNNAQPDVLWVGMTAPKQEKWIYEHKDKLNVRFIGAVGAVFDFYVGNVKRSPPFFQKMGLEWLPRLIQDPKRLWRRNFISTPKFFLKVLRQKFTR